MPKEPEGLPTQVEAGVLVDSGKAGDGRSRKMLLVGTLLAAALAVAGVARFLWRDGAGPGPAADAPSSASPAVRRQETPVPRPAAPDAGDCSEADQQAELCTRPR